MSGAIKLTKLDPDSETQVAELRRQRVLCGWGSENVDKWLAAIRSGGKSMYWIEPLSPHLFPLPPNEPLSFGLGEAFGPPPPDEAFQPLGHVSLDWVDSYGDESQGSREKGWIQLAGLFVLRSQQGNGLGNKVLDAIDARAREEGAKEIRLNTFSAENAQNAGFWESLGLVFNPAARVNERWYAGKGYERYKLDQRMGLKGAGGEDVPIEAVYMRKVL